jgi:type II secretory pathway component PulF
MSKDGSVAEGQIEANGRQEAFRQIDGMGLRPIRLSEAAAGAAKKNGKPGKGLNIPKPAAAAAPKKPFEISFGKPSTNIPARVLENFTRLLSSLLAAGVPLSRALVILYKEASTPVASAKWKEVHDYVVDGMSLADAMAKSPKVFPRVYVAMVQAGETGGFLDLVLSQIADFQARDKELRSKVLTAMLYPAILLALAVGVVIFLLTFFIPRFTLVFEGFGAKLPMATQIVVGLSHTIRSYGIFVLIGGILIFLAVRNWLASDEGRRKWENMVLHLPIIGKLVAEFAMARFCRMLGTLLGAGVPLVQALNVARKSMGNQILVDTVGKSIERVQEGGQLGTSLAECKNLFTGSVTEMISVAEESSRLDSELVRIANVTESDLDRELKTAVAFAEPLMLFLIAGLIGTIFISMVLPIFTIQQHIK